MYANICFDLCFQADWDSKGDSKPPDSWPTDGEVEWSEYSTRYREELDPVIKEVSLHIKGGEMVQ